MELIFASQNANKLGEITSKLGPDFTVKSLSDLNFNQPLPETGTTLHENSKQKALFVYNLFGKNCFADDSGLEVEALNGEPGVHSAYYAGPERDSEKNIELLLQKLSNAQNRRARFVTVFTLVLNGEIFVFEGEVKGNIINHKRGKFGFGYDPIFVPEGYHKTFAEMSLEEKNRISHRAKGIEKLKNFLRERSAI